jgi:cytochrome c556
VADAEARSRDAEVLALIGVVVAADTHEVKEASRIPKWQEYSHDMTASMGKVATALKANDGMAAKAAFLESAKSCNSCHNDFRDH